MLCFKKFDTQRWGMKNTSKIILYVKTDLLCCSFGIVGKITLARSKSPRITRVLYSIKLRSNVYPITLHEKSINDLLKGIGDSVKNFV